ncbi:MAG: diacylglycerol kinase family lipid kinase [Lachnospiraceae bacterium]|nr:diacylglycerol kinase family lipid kinase [Lachnospiraceae bacterium]
MLYIIVNPASKSGLGRKKWETFKEKLNQNSIVYEVFFTDKQNGATRCAKEILGKIRPDSSDILCVLGGDGTINEAVNAFDGIKDIPLAYLPTGSSNDLARSLHLVSSPDELIRHIKNPITNMADTGMLQTANGKKRHFCVSCGIGYDAAVCKEALDSKLKDALNRLGLGKLTYAGIALKQLFSVPSCGCDITFEDGSTKHFDRLLFAVSMVQPYEGGGIRMAPMADCHDGLFDVMVVAGLRKWRALYLLPLAFFGLHTKAKNVYFFKVRKLVIETEVPLIVHADGEYCGKQQKITLSCQKNGLKFI